MRTHIAAARHDRPAARHPFPRRRCRHGGDPEPKSRGRGAFPAVLHCFTGGRALAMTAVETRHVHFLQRRAHLQEVRRAAERSRPSCRRIASWWRRTRPTSLPASSEASATNPPMWSKPRRFWPRCAGLRWDYAAICGPDERQFLPSVQQGAASPHESHRHDSGLRVVGRRAAAGTRLGRLQSAKSQEPPTALFAAGGAPQRRQGHDASWSTRRPTCASSSSMPAWTGSTASSTPTSMPTTPTASTTCGRCSSTSAAASTPTWTNATARVLFHRFGYCFVTPPGSAYPPIMTEHRIKAGRA